MGLTVHYELRLPGDTPVARVEQIVEQLRACAISNGMPMVSPLYHIDADTIGDGLANPLRDFEAFFHFTVERVQELRDGEQPLAPSDGIGAIGFITHPGHGSEAAPFGLLKPLGGSEEYSDCWFWQSFCKTQYASNVSEEHFVRCHLALIAILDRAQALGLTVTVHDEGGYWESRSTDELLGALQKMNRLVAGVAGRLHDAIAPKHRVDAAIFKHPDFERLETDHRESE